MDNCEKSLTGEHHWRPYLSGGHKCIYCRREWVPVEPCVDPDEINAKSWEPEPEPWWPKVLGIVVAIILIAVIFAPVGVK